MFYGEQEKQRYPVLSYEKDAGLFTAFFACRVYPELAERDAQIDPAALCRKSKRDITLGHDLSAG